MTSRKPLIPWNKRLGTVGEKAIQSRLAYFSSTTKYEEDAGLDFYCELIENDSPSIQFYVQAKSTVLLDEKWGSGVPKSTIIYWLYQPHPVFLIIYDDVSKDCYWLSIEDIRYYLIDKLQKSSSETVYITVDKSNKLEEDKDKNQLFIDKIKEATSLTQLFLGQPKFTGNGYVKNIPHPPRSYTELRKITENVRKSLYSLIQHYKKPDSLDLEKARIYCEFLTDFDKSHYNHFFWLGQIYMILKEPRKAKKNFSEVLEIFHRDKRWPLEDKNEMINATEFYIRCCEQLSKK